MKLIHRYFDAFNRHDLEAWKRIGSAAVKFSPAKYPFRGGPGCDAALKDFRR